jgi:hypothetical protein
MESGAIIDLKYRIEENNRNAMGGAGAFVDYRRLNRRQTADGDIRRRQ